ncbi:MAG: hypothetical protein Q7W13_15260 [Bacteroidia bacterium]|nr:hypothetical protein [Bacteroidia bacterium]
MKKTLPLFLFIALTACSAKLLLPTQTDVNRVSAKYPGYTWNELMAGKSIYEQNWRILKDPASRNEEQWKEIVPHLVKKLNKRKGKEVIDSKAQETLLKYLITMSMVPKNTSR